MLRACSLMVNPSSLLGVRREKKATIRMTCVLKAVVDQLLPDLTRGFMGSRNWSRSWYTDTTDTC
jgi:hypothetical protein